MADKPLCTMALDRETFLVAITGNSLSSAAADAHIIGEKLRSGSAEAQAALSRQGRYKDVAGNLKVKEVRIAEDERFVICHDPEAAERDAAIMFPQVTTYFSVTRRKQFCGIQGLAAPFRAAV